MRNAVHIHGKTDDVDVRGIIVLANVRITVYLVLSFCVSTNIKHSFRLSGTVIHFTLPICVHTHYNPANTHTRRYDLPCPHQLHHNTR